MRDDFCAFILTHGRPDKVKTLKTLEESGYTGKIYIVIDDEDKTAAEYYKRYGEKVLMFSKADIAKRFDEGDNFNDRRAIIYARNACFELAKQVGCQYFIELDDDYTGLYYRRGENNDYGVWRLDYTFNALIDSLIDFLDSSPSITSVAISQGGDHIGGIESGTNGIKTKLLRKAMNTFVCSTEKPFQFFGRINEDVNTYTCGQLRGLVFFTVTHAQVNQAATQSNSGGMTELYLDSGTYIKSFYSVMYAPSCVKVGSLGDSRSPHRRLHHSIDWNAAVPLIVSENYKKARG